MQQHRVDTQILHEEQILEAIDQLRRRKARPDADRICNYLLRKFSVDARDTIADLHRLIEAEKVIQVDYKGNTSYRNASKWSRLQLYKNRPEGFVKEKLNSGMVASAVAELVVEEPDYLDQGVPAYRLVEQLLDGVSNPTSRRMVEDFLGKEVASGNLTRLSNGNYSLVATSDMTTTASPHPEPTHRETFALENGNARRKELQTVSSTTGGLYEFDEAENDNDNDNENDDNENENENEREHESGNVNGNGHDRVNENENESENGNESRNENESGNGNGNEDENENENENGNENENENENENDNEIENENDNENGSENRNQNGSNTESGKQRNKENEHGYENGNGNENKHRNLVVTDSRSNTPRFSRHTSPKLESDQHRKKEEGFEVVVGRNRPESSLSNEPPVAKDQEIAEVTEISSIPASERPLGPGSISALAAISVSDPSSIPILTSTPSSAQAAEAVEDESKEEPKSTDQVHNLKRSSKSERKQRLLVRTDDPMDIEIKFEDFRKEEVSVNGQKEKREESGHLSEEREDDEAGRSSTNPSPTPSNVNVGSFRSARRKRARKVFDPSDNNLVKRKRGRQPGSHAKSSMTQDSQDQNKTMIKDGPCRQCSLCAKEKQENLVACRDCTVRAHPSCIYSPEELAQKAGSNWQCERCKSCTICCETSDAGTLATCFNCDEAYHYYCHTPRIILPKTNGKWQCNDCVQKQFKTNVNQNIGLVNNRPDTPSNPPVLPPVLSPQVSPARGSLDQMDDDGQRDGIDPNIPDASDWTSEQVYQYFARLFPKEAEVFRQQDIDGHSLLLMKRSDVLSGLDLLLGPALKIYRHVLKLQVRRDDPKLYWL